MAVKIKKIYLLYYLNGSLKTMNTFKHFVGRTPSMTPWNYASISETVELYLQSWTSVRWLMLVEDIIPQRGVEGSLMHHLFTVPRSGKGMAILAERTLVGKVRQLSLLRTVSQLPKHCTFNAQDSLSWGQPYLGNTSSNYKVTHVF
jgi:hypothetical protein